MIIDTDFVILYLKKDPKTLEKFRELIENNKQSKIYTTHVSAWELYRGAYISSRKEENLRKINKFLSYLPILPFTEEIDKRFGMLFVKLENDGKRIGVMDTLIASIALEYNLPVVTRNVKHFEKTEVMIETW